MENVKVYWQLLWTAPTYTYSCKDISVETLSNVEGVVIDESPSSLSSQAVMQMDDDLLEHLNVYISMFKQLNGDMWKSTKNILLV